MLEDHEVKEVKEILISIMLTGNSHRSGAWFEAYKNNLFYTGNYGLWYITDKGRAWLDEQQRS